MRSDLLARDPEKIRFCRDFEGGLLYSEKNGTGNGFRRIVTDSSDAEFSLIKKEGREGEEPPTPAPIEIRDECTGRYTG